MCWEPGYAKTILHGTERLPESIFYRIYIARITGRRVTLERATPADTELSMSAAGEGGWLQRILWLVLGKFKRSSL
jgi:hypothetical protein